MTTRLEDFGVTDYTPLMSLVPREFSIFEEIGLIQEADIHFGTQEVHEFERITLGEDAMDATSRGGDRSFAGDDEVQKESFRIPFFTNDKITVPAEVQGFRQWGTEDAPANVDSLVNRRVARIQRNHAKLRRDAFYTALVENKVHAKKKGVDTPLAKNFSTVWGEARNTDSMTLGTDKPFEKFEAARQHVIAEAGDNADAYEMIVIVNSATFSAIVNDASVVAAYDSYASEQEPLRERLSGNRNNKLFRHKGVVLLEDISGKVPANKVYVMPLGIDGMWQIAYAPADTIEHANQIAEQSYLFMKENYRAVTIESETSMALINTMPQLITEIDVTIP